MNKIGLVFAVELCQHCGQCVAKSSNNRRSSRCPECKTKAIIENGS